MLALWIVPLLVVAPLFSRDVFSYAAQGEMMSHHINPYNYGPGTIGSGPYVTRSDPLWLNTPAPYGPLFLMLAGWSAAASGHHALFTVILLRLMSVAGRRAHRLLHPEAGPGLRARSGPAFTLASLNPLTLLALIGGAHNDAIMVGLLLAGVTAAKYRHPVVGIVLCTLGRGHQGPGRHRHRLRRLGLAGHGVPWRQRVRPLLNGGLISVAVMAAVVRQRASAGAGSPTWGRPATVRSWLAPATAIGLVSAALLHRRPASGWRHGGRPDRHPAARPPGGGRHRRVYCLRHKDRIAGL